MSRISLKVKIALSIAAIVLVSSYLLFYSKKTTTIEPTQTNTVTLENNSGVDETDSDNDGLKDWEETLWGTNPRIADTDADDTPDGEEVKRGRDPLVPGPNDIFADKEKIAEIVKQSESFSKLNTTERFGQDLFAKVLLLKQNGGEIGPEIDEELVKSAVETLSINQKEKEYDVFTFISNPDNSKEAVKSYANKIIDHLKNNSIQSTESELALLTRYSISDGADEASLNKIALNSIGYAEIAEKYHKMVVPSEFIELHRKLTNTMSHLSSDAHSMSLAKTDPVLALAAAGQFSKDQEESISILKEMAQKIRAMGIVFNNSDPGISFIRSL